MSISPQQIYDVCSQKLQQNPEQLRLLLARASAAIRLSNPKLALQDLNRYLSKSPNDHSARLLRVQCAEYLDDADAALDDLNYILEASPQHSQALFRRAKILAEQSDRKRAISAFQQAIQCEHFSGCSEPSSTSSFQARTYQAFQPHKFTIRIETKSALQVIKNRIAAISSEKGVDLWLKKGIELRRANRLEDAAAAFTRAFQEGSGGRGRGGWDKNEANEGDLNRAKSEPKSSQKSESQSDVSGDAKSRGGEAKNEEEKAIEALLNRAFCYDQMQRYQSAILDYQRVLERDPRYALAWHNLGVCYDKLEQRERAIECFNKAISIDEQVDFLISRAWTHRQMANYDLALQDYNRGLQIQPNCYKLLFARAFTYEKAGELALSLQDYSACIKIDPKQFAYHNRGNVLARLNQQQLAVQDFTAAIQLNGQASESYLSRAQSYMQIGKKQQALQDYQTAYQLSQSMEHGLALADAQKRTSGFKEALATYNLLLEKFPDQEAEILAQRALVHRKLSMFKEVLSDASKALIVNQNDAKLLTNRGYAYAQLQYYELAIQDFSKALKIDPHNAQALLNRGVSFDKIGRQEEALRDLTAAIQLSPTDSAAYFSRGATLDSLGRYEEAMSDYTRALELENRGEQREARNSIPRAQ